MRNGRERGTRRGTLKDSAGLVLNGQWHLDGKSSLFSLMGEDGWGWGTVLVASSEERDNAKI